ncbi:ovostatin-like [Ambystoma mexicanum]|uniref:ovostatin-like n=1 Tax=Ambystoma mexicanum TaxID=8296 RepID=UPI0037E89A26
MYEESGSEEDKVTHFGVSYGTKQVPEEHLDQESKMRVLSDTLHSASGSDTSPELEFATTDPAEHADAGANPGFRLGSGLAVKANTDFPLSSGLAVKANPDFRLGSGLAVKANPGFQLGSAFAVKANTGFWLGSGLALMANPGFWLGTGLAVKANPGFRLSSCLAVKANSGCWLGSDFAVTANPGFQLASAFAVRANPAFRLGSGLAEKANPGFWIGSGFALKGNPGFQLGSAFAVKANTGFRLGSGLAVKANPGFCLGSGLAVPSVAVAQMAFISLTVGNETQRRSVVVNKLPNFCVMKFAKTVYKPGDNVTCRVFCLNGTLHPHEETIEAFEVRDSRNNLVMQQRNVTMQNKIARMHYQIGSDPLIGWYSATARTASGLQAYGSFECKRYVLPTFDTELKAAYSVNSIDLTLDISVSGRYTFVKPLAATVNISVCRLPNTWEPKQTCNLNPNGICWTYDGKLGANGTLNLTVGLLQFQLPHKGLQNSLAMKAVFTEEGTDVQVTKTQNVWISDSMPTPYPVYDATDTNYKRGINCTGELLLQDASGKPMPGERIELLYQGSLVAYCDTSDEGRCRFSVNTSDFTAGRVSLEIKYDKNSQCFPSSNIGCPYNWGQYPGNQVSFSRYYSPSDSYMRLDRIPGPLSCGTNVSITGSVKLNRKHLSEDGTVVLGYAGFARGEVTSLGSMKITVDNGEWQK